MLDQITDSQFINIKNITNIQFYMSGGKVFMSIQLLSGSIILDIKKDIKSALRRMGMPIESIYITNTVRGIIKLSDYLES